MTTFHYTYRITNIILNKHYYGCRTSKNCDPVNDIGVKYFSSSTDKLFKNDQKENPENFKYKVIKIFATRKQAERFETKLHLKFQVQINESFYNKAINTDMGFSVLGRKQTKEHIAKRFKNITGFSYEEKYGKDDGEKRIEKIKKSKENISSETRQKMSNSRIGMKLSKVHRESISNGLKKRYDNSEFYESFCQTMNIVNKNLEKRIVAGEKIKELWKNKDYLRKMKDRKQKTKKIIKVITPLKNEFSVVGFGELIKEFNFNPTMVRKSLKTGQTCSSKHKNMNEKSKNTIGYIFKELKNED